jgi:hypothetical protein
MFHPLTQNTIKAFKSRAQAIFSLLEKTPPPRFTKFEFMNCILVAVCEIESNFKSVQFFYTSCSSIAVLP